MGGIISPTDKQAISKAASQEQSRKSLYCVIFGSALFWVWGFICYLSPIMFPPEASAESSIGIEYGFFASQAGATIFALIVVFLSRWRKVVIRRGTFFGAALAMGISALFLAWAVQEGNIPVMIICGLIDGIGVPILGVAWGTRYSLLSKRMLPLVVLSFLIAYLLYYVISFLPYWPAIIIVAVVPIISWFLWNHDARLRHQASAEVFASPATEDQPATPGEFLAGTWKARIMPWASLSIFLVASFIGNFITSFILGQGYAGVDVLYNGGILVCALICTMTLTILAARKNSLTVSNYYKITIAFTAIGLVAILVFGAAGTPIGGAFVQGSALFLQVLIILVVTQNTQETGISPLLSFSVGQGITAAVVFVSNVLGKFVHSYFGAYELTLGILCGCGLLVVFFILVTQVDHPDFAPKQPDAAPSVSEKPETDQNHQTEAVAKAFGLTNREEEILGYLARGRSLPYISDALFVTTGTVKTHTINIYRKTGVNSRQELLDLIESHPTNS